MVQKVVIFSTMLLSGTMLLGCRDIFIKEGNLNPYEASLSTKNNSNAKFFCEEAYLVYQHTKTELNDSIVNAAKDICFGDFSITKTKIKTLAINPGEYYAKLSANISCPDKISPNFESDAEQLCRSLLGQSYRSLQEQNNAH